MKRTVISVLGEAKSGMSHFYLERRREMYDQKALEAAAGRTIDRIEGVAEESERVEIVFQDGTRLVMRHEQDCCESVRLTDVSGFEGVDWNGAMLRSIEEASKTAERDECSETGTWTFYRVMTDRGLLVLRWLGESNGYYSEGVTATFDESEG